MERDSALKKAKLAITRQVNKAKKDQKDAGIRARKINKSRRDQIRELEASHQAIPPDLYIVEREPDKNPTSNELDDLLPHPSLVQAVQELEKTIIEGQEGEPSQPGKREGESGEPDELEDGDIYSSDSDGDIQIITSYNDQRVRIVDEPVVIQQVAAGVISIQQGPGELDFIAIG